MSYGGPFAIVVPIGPGEIETIRLRELLESVRTHEPGVAAVVIVDDRQINDPLALPALPFQVHVIKNPRDTHRSHGLYDGLVCGLLTAHAFVAERFPTLSFVLKTDTDALLIAQISDRINHLFEDHPTAGIAGATLYECDGRLRHIKPWDDRITKYAQRLQLWRWDSARQRKGLEVRQGLVGRRGRIGSTIRAALANGYSAGQHAQGGAYAIRGELLQQWRKRRIFDDAHVWQGTHLAEDVVFSVYAYACGFGLLDAAYQHKVFGVTYRGLPLPPERLCRDGYGVVHSTKCTSWDEEARVRMALRDNCKDLCAT